MGGSKGPVPAASNDTSLLKTPTPSAAPPAKGLPQPPAPPGQQVAGFDANGKPIYEDTEETKQKKAGEAEAQQSKAEVAKIQAETAALLRTEIERSMRDRKQRQGRDAKAMSLLSTLLTGPLGLTGNAPGQSKSLLGQ